MNNDGGLQNIYLFLTKERLLFAVSDQSGEMAYAGATPSRRRKPEGIAELYDYPLSRLAEPKILNQVVGGLLTLNVDGTETWLCRFSGAKMHRMQRFCQKQIDVLQAAVVIHIGAGKGTYRASIHAPPIQRVAHRAGHRFP